MMIQCQHVQKYHGAQLVLADVSFEVREGDKIGLIGRNGAGKSTLFRLLGGHDKPDSGLLAVRRGAVVGMLAQIQDESGSVLEMLRGSFAEPLSWQERMRAIEAEMAAGVPGDGDAAWNALLKEYGALQDRFEAAGGYEIEAEINRVAGGLGIGAEDYERPFASLSGGEKTKAALAALLLKRPDLLLLDEPTNHLDMAAIEWLERFLQEYAGTVVVVSHDRYFLDAVIGRVVELEDGEAAVYHTNYSGYQQEKEERLLQQFADYQEQQKRIKKMQESIKRLIEWGNNANPPNPSFHRRAASMQKALDRMVRVKRPQLERRAMDLKLSPESRSGERALTLERLGKSLGGRLLFAEASGGIRYGERVALLGGNGAGKSTLLRILLGEDTPDSGRCRIGSRIEIGYLAQEAVPDDGRQTVLGFFREQAGIEEGEARGRLARFLFFGPDVFKRVSQLSGGEWTRLRFAVLMYTKPNLLLLDEPTNHLDIDSREALEEALEEYTGTVLAVSHDRYFINRCFDRIWTIGDGRFAVYGGSYAYYKEKSAELAARAAATESGSPRQNEREAAARPVASGAEAEPPARGGARQPKADTARMEADIAAAEARLEELDRQMASPEFASDAERLSTLHAEREEVQAGLDTLYDAWVTASR
ncbi:ribosomal protection-like ABC-F family protein [Paenibacillus glufosinatiresistens]|uniref:ribosomal protection-like ABC-F family protein n=1 Tax=Paenibacillus glufosinatiresistens TaxID=3070657 RepID=UPI00286DEC6D|nr:ABC-F family ATP-binding cassette domain-containing protein [Paenibacillus sp. YX.27]